MADLKVATANNTERVLPDKAVEGFGSRLRGELILPSDAGYDAARAIWNGMIDKRPGLIARCSGVADVITGVRFAREHDLLVSVRGGGHNVAGTALCDGGLVIDLSGMKGVHVDPVGRTARVQPGVTLGDLDHETQHFGLAVPAGIVTTTGVAGLTLGGGTNDDLVLFTGDLIRPPDADLAILKTEELLTGIHPLIDDVLLRCDHQGAPFGGCHGDTTHQRLPKACGGLQDEGPMDGQVLV